MANFAHIEEAKGEVEWGITWVLTGRYQGPIGSSYSPFSWVDENLAVSLLKSTQTG